ncbi:hypothetical protein ACFE04_003659 [Oxalis oulophora]
MARADQVSCNLEHNDFDANSSYSKHRDTLLASLASNAAANGGFYNSSAGNDSHPVYATALCRGDASTTECSSCVTIAANNSISECPFQYKVLSWAGDPQCFVHYANTNIFGVLQMNPRLTANETDTISWNSSGFNETWTALMDKLKNEAIAGSSELKYAAGKLNYTTTQYIYGLVQCTPDLSSYDCDKCLTQNIYDYESLYSGLVGGAIYRPNCIFQYYLNLFYKEDNNSPLPSPGPSSTGNGGGSSTHAGNGGGSSAKTIAIVVGSAVIFMALVAAGLYLLLRQRRRRMMEVQLIERNEDGSRNENIINEDGSRSRRENIVNEDSSNFSHLDFEIIRVATDNFSDNKILGKGGFGPVYKAWRSWNERNTQSLIDPILGSFKACIFYSDFSNEPVFTVIIVKS